MGQVQRTKREGERGEHTHTYTHTRRVLQRLAHKDADSSVEVGCGSEARKRCVSSHKGENEAGLGGAVSESGGRK